MKLSCVNFPVQYNIGGLQTQVIDMTQARHRVKVASLELVDGNVVVTLQAPIAGRSTIVIRDWRSYMPEPTPTKAEKVAK